MGGVWRGRYTRLGVLGCQVFLAAERVFAVVDGVPQFLQHHIQRRVLGQFDHEHAGLHTNVARVRLTWRAEKQEGVLPLKPQVGLFHNKSCCVLEFFMVLRKASELLCSKCVAIMSLLR